MQWQISGVNSIQFNLKIMENDSFNESLTLKNNPKLQKRSTGELLADLGWEYERLSLSGRACYNAIMTKVGILKDTEVWREGFDDTKTGRKD